MRTFGSFLASTLLVLAIGCGSDSGGPTAKHDGGGVIGGPDTGVTPVPGIDAPATPGIDAMPGIDATPSIDAPATPGIDAPEGVDGAQVIGVDGAVKPVVDGGAVIDGGKAIDGGAAAGTCVLPSCMAGVGANCVPSGACVTQSDNATFTTSTCYANGVKQVQQTGTTGITVSMKNAGGVCYALVVDTATLIAAMAGGAVVLPVKNAAGATIATLGVDMATQQTTVTCPGAQPVALDSGCTGSISLTGVSSTAATTCTQGTCTP